MNRCARSAAVGDPKKRVELVGLKAAVEQVREEFSAASRRPSKYPPAVPTSSRSSTGKWPPTGAPRLQAYPHGSGFIAELFWLAVIGQPDCR